MSKRLEELRDLAERDVGGDSETDGGGDTSGEESLADEDLAGENLADGSHADAAGAPASAASRSRLGRSPFSARGFLLTLLVLVAGLVVGSAVPLVGSLTRYVGLFVAAFALGLVRSRRAYLETAVAGALAAGGAFILGTLATGTLLVGTNLLAEYGVPVAGVGITVGVLLSVAGLYFGRDLKAGLGRDLS